jgi:hypothetical protein
VVRDNQVKRLLVRDGEPIEIHERARREAVQLLDDDALRSAVLSRLRN